MKSNFTQSVISNIILSIYRTSTQSFNIVTRHGVFSLGIIWSCLKHLVIIIGISLIFTAGLRGTGIQIEYFFFNLLLWFYFADITNSTINQQYNKAIFSQEEINSFVYFFAHFLRITIQFFILLLISFMFFYISDSKIYHINLIMAFITIGLFALIYAVFMSSALHQKPFLIELHQFGMQALFFASGSIIPISVVPNPIRDYLLYNPIVHIQESIKSDVTGIELSYIDMNYPLVFILYGLMFLLPALHYKNNRFKEA
jgi:capsular polysaccharide transport system permease protein